MAPLLVTACEGATIEVGVVAEADIEAGEWLARALCPYGDSYETD